MNFTKGEILFDPNFIYPDGGKPCDKLLLVINKNHIYPEDVIVVPAKTNIQNYPYRPNCNEERKEFYFNERIGFYKENTILQLHQLVSVPASTLKEMVDKKRIDRLSNKTTQEEFGRIINCLKKIKDDIPFFIQDLIF